MRYRDEEKILNHLIRALAPTIFPKMRCPLPRALVFDSDQFQEETGGVWAKGEWDANKNVLILLHPTTPERVVHELTHWAQYCRLGGGRRLVWKRVTPEEYAQREEEAESIAEQFKSAARHLYREFSESTGSSRPLPNFLPPPPWEGPPIPRVAIKKQVWVGVWFDTPEIESKIESAPGLLEYVGSIIDELGRKYGLALEYLGFVSIAVEEGVLAIYANHSIILDPVVAEAWVVDKGMTKRALRAVISHEFGHYLAEVTLPEEEEKVRDEEFADRFAKLESGMTREEINKVLDNLGRKILKKFKIG